MSSEVIPRDKVRSRNVAIAFVIHRGRRLQRTQFLGVGGAGCMLGWRTTHCTASCKSWRLLFGFQLHAGVAVVRVFECRMTND
jgi:hypothetical protein